MRPTRNALDPARLPPLPTTEQAAELLGVHVVYPAQMGRRRKDCRSQART